MVVFYWVSVGFVLWGLCKSVRRVVISMYVVYMDSIFLRSVFWELCMMLFNIYVFWVFVWMKWKLSISCLWWILIFENFNVMNVVNVY